MAYSVSAPDCSTSITISSYFFLYISSYCFSVWGKLLQMVYVCNIRVVFAFCAADGSSSEIMGRQTKHRKKILWWVTGEHFWWQKNNAGTSLGFQIASHHAWIPSLIICQNYLHIAGFSHSIWFCWMSLVAVALTSMGHLSMLCAY